MQNVYELTGDTKLIDEANFIFENFLDMINKSAPNIKQNIIDLQAQVTSDIGNSLFSNIKFDLGLDIDSQKDLIKAISIYLMLLNVLEERRDVRNIKNDFKGSVNTLLKEGFSKDSIKDVLKNLSINPTFTAHPTESRRKVFLEAHQKISQDLSMIFAYDEKQAKDDLIYRLKLLWQSDLIRKEKIKVLFEHNNLLYSIEDNILKALISLHEDVEEVTGLADKSIINLGSWIGGDRDGNPYVTNTVLSSVMKKQHNTIIKIYLERIEILLKELSISSDMVDFNDDLISSIEQEKEYLNSDDKLIFQSEPARLKLLLIKRKLKNKLININTTSKIDFAYKNKDELIADIDLILSSLDKITARGLKELRNLVLITGFKLAKLDFREHKKKLHSAITEVFSILGYADNDFVQKDENSQLEIINEAFNSNIILENITGKVSQPTKEIIEVFNKIKWARENISEDILESFILSMTTSAVDLMIVLWFAKQSGLYVVGKEGLKGKAPISITPLFETIQDLKSSTKIIQKLFDNPHYNEYLKNRNYNQEIMIGYSDSSKDGGTLASNINLHNAISNLIELGEKLDVNFLLFHGRGGSMSRGGGSTYDAIMSSGYKSVNGFFKVTEQGEQISSKYLNSNLAKHNFTQTLNATLQKSLHDKYEIRNDKEEQKYKEVFNTMSEISMQVYQSLVYENPNFTQYLLKATPIEFISNLNIGSRPSKRSKANSISDLRAIPWVFSWTQNRSILSAWYGVGSGLQAISNTPNGDEILKDCYKKVPFFKAFINNLAMALMKTNIEISKLYSEFYENETARKEIVDLIDSEFAKTIKYVLLIREEKSLLEKNVELRQSILLKKPYLNALNILQLDLIKKYSESNSAKQKEELSSLISSTIIGIAQGMRNTG